MSLRLNFLSITASPDLGNRCHQIAKDFSYTYHHLSQAQEVADFNYEQVQFILTDTRDALPVIRNKYKESFILVVVSDQESQEQISALKRTGANQTMKFSDALYKSRLEFIASQVIRAAFVPVKMTEFPENAIFEFTLYHLMPLNQKLLPILPKGSELNSARLKKLEGIGEVFVRRDEIDRYRMYVESHPDTTATGLKSRCRAQYLSLSNAHSQLMLMITDAEENNTDREAKWLYERCEILGKELLMTLSAINESWDVLNNASLGEMGSVERAPTVAAYSGLISFLTSVGEPRDVMMAALLSGVGMLELNPQILKKIRDSGDPALLTGEDLALYRKHPLLSLQVCENKKIHLKESVKNIILNSHEKIDGSGFPNGKKDKIPEEAMLLQFCESIDRVAIVKMGQSRKPIKEVRLKILDDLFKDGETVSDEFLHKIKPII